MRLGILGGTFDPIHRGHLAMARHALRQFRLDQVLFVPAARSPHKKNRRPVASAKHRLAMIRLAIGKTPHFKVSRIEIKRGGLSYTIQTLRSLRRKYPVARFFLILGQDAYQGLATWKNSGTIKRLVHFLVAKRPGCRSLAKAGAAVSWIRMPFFPVASSEIRAAIKGGLKLDDDLPRAVMSYIKAKHLYGNRP